MVKFYPSISDDLRDWMLSQSMFFTASAPLVGKHVNLSPKGHLQSTFAVLNPNQVAYLDATGSGAETISHIYENGRVTLMFNSFGPSPRILRLFCTGRVVERGDGKFKSWFEQMVDSGLAMDKAVLDGPRRSGDEESRPTSMSLVGIRAIILLDVFKVQTSCGFGVPVFPNGKSEETEGSVKAEMSTEGNAKTWDDRPTMPQWAGKMAEKDGALQKWMVEYNADSLDGCPGLISARREKGQWLVLEDGLARIRRMVIGEWDAFGLGLLLPMVAFLIAIRVGLVQLDLNLVRLP